MVVGALLGSLWGPGAEALGWIGDLFIRLIRMIVAACLCDHCRRGLDGRSFQTRFIRSQDSDSVYADHAGCGLILAVFLQPGVGVDLMGHLHQPFRKLFPCRNV